MAKFPKIIGPFLGCRHRPLCCSRMLSKIPELLLPWQICQFDWRFHEMRRTNALLLIAFALSSSADIASATPWIVWELKNAFPLIAEEDYRGLRSMFGDNPSMHNLYLELAEVDRQKSNMSFERDALKAARPSTLRWADV